MKIFKIITFVLLLIAEFPATGMAQANTILKQISKQEAKQAAKVGVKQAVRAEIKQTLKAEAKQAIKAEAKQSVKAEMKQAVKAEAKQAIRAEMKQVAKSETKQAAKAEMKQASRMDATKTVQTETKQVALDGAKKGRFSDYKNKMENSSTTSKTGLEKKKLESCLNKDALKHWKKYAGVSPEKRTVLLKDIQQNPELEKIFNSNPQMLETYCNFINSPRYRSDVTMLRYAYNNAGKSSLMYTRGPKNRRWLTGNDLILEDVSGQTFIRQKGTGRLLGKLEGNTKDGLIVKIHGNSDPALLDLYPMRNTTYMYGNCSWTTDNFGRPYIIKMRANSGIAMGGRDKDFIARVKRFKTDYDINGNQLSAKGNNYNDIAGHIVPDSWGGPSNGINIVPQDALMNNSGLWKKSELQGLNFARQGNAVERTVVLKYSDNFTQRPSSFKVTQTVNGKFDTVQGVEMNEVELSNFSGGL